MKRHRSVVPKCGASHMLEFESHCCGDAFFCSTRIAFEVTPGPGPLTTRDGSAVNCDALMTDTQARCYPKRGWMQTCHSYRRYLARIFVVLRRLSNASHPHFNYPFHQSGATNLCSWEYPGILTIRGVSASEVGISDNR